MADSYHIIDGQVVPFHGGRKDTNTGEWRDATPLELQLQEQLAAAEEALAEAAAALEAAREDAGMRRFADMLLGGLNDIQDALGFTDEDKLCANGSEEMVAEIAELREDAERYRWLRLRLAGAEHVAELVEFNTDMHPELPDNVDAAIDAAREARNG